jgi:hypothetical protein
MWPALIVQQLAPLLPAEFTAEPRVDLGSYFETWSPPKPTLLIDADLANQYEYEVLVYDQDRGRQLAAAFDAEA